MVNQVSDAQLQEMAKVMAQASGAQKVILFGSRARGKAQAHSDLDFLLVIADEDWQWNGDLFEKLKPAGDAKMAARDAGFCYPMDVIPLGNSRFEDDDSLIGREAKRDGIVLFERIYG
jgi:predicted nucleotidyltransferase